LTWTLYFDPHYLDSFMHLDANADGTVSAAEVDARHADIANLALPDISATNLKTGTKPTGTVGAVGLVDLKTTGLHSEGFADLDDFPIVAVPVTFTFTNLDVRNVQLTYNLFVVEAFGEHINIAEVDLGDTSKVFQFDPGIPTVVIGDVLDGTAPSDAAGTGNAASATGIVSGSKGPTPTSAKSSDGPNLAPIVLGLITLVLAVGFRVHQRRARRRSGAIATTSSTPSSPTSARLTDDDTDDDTATGTAAATDAESTDVIDLDELATAAVDLDHDPVLPRA
jgi:hypothetical protein